MRGQKTRLVAKVTMQGEYRVIYETASEMYILRYREYIPYRGYATRTICKVPTLAMALFRLYNEAQVQGL